MDNIFKQIILFGNENNWEPNKDPQPTDAPPGSVGKVEEMRRRVEFGE